MAATIQPPPPAPLIATKHTASNAPSCPSCGTSVVMNIEGSEDAQRKIAELEAQMERLKEKATAAVDRCADYEDQIRSLRATSNGPSLPRSNTFDASNLANRPSHEEPRPTTSNSTKQSRFSFLTGRYGSPSNSTTPPPPPLPKDTSAPTQIDITLLNELERERTLRAKAEARAQKVDSEIEELSVQLFSQANEMVAEERRARAKLEERVAMLEKKDRDKMARLERLEKAVSRIDRVKAMLNQPPTGALASTLASPSGKR